MTRAGYGHDDNDKIAGVAIDDWKLDIFKRHLDAAGYKYEKEILFTPGTLILRVSYEWAHKLKPVIEAAQKECAEFNRADGRTPR